MPKQQINIKLPPALIEALKAKAGEEGMTLTDLIQGFCERGLGLPTPPNLNLDEVYERISTQVELRISNQLDERLPVQIDERIAEQLAPIQEQITMMENALGECSA